MTTLDKNIINERKRVKIDKKPSKSGKVRVGNSLVGSKIAILSHFLSKNPQKVEK
jgi:hypothetical protein